MDSLATIKALADRGAHADALKALAAYMEHHSSDIEANKLSAEIHFRLGLREKGFEHALRAFDLDRTDVAYALDCAYNLVRAGRRADALRIAQILSGYRLDDPYHCDTLGTVFTHCQVPEKALPHFQRACMLVPASSQFLFNLASAQRMLGAVGDSEANLDRAIRLAPGDGAAYLARTQLRRQTVENNHVAELKAALARAASAEAQVSIRFALAKELEDLGEYQQSFAYLSAASRLQRSRIAYDPAIDIQLMRALRDLEYDSTSIRETETLHSYRRPIFVMGLPRSGTTLVDRIIASVPGVRSAGEVNALAGAVWRIAARNGRRIDPNAAVVDAVRTSASQIGVNYVRSFEGQYDGPFIDKTPSNFLFGGLIRTALPEARMVCLRRDPMDTCYAMYKTLFSGAYAYTYDFRELADYYVEWDRLIHRWESALGDAWLTVRYEDLIRQPETTMRRIVAHCRLPWHSACLRFHELDAPVTSASAGQVNRPLHGDSIGLWRNYSAELRDLAERLSDAGIAIDANSQVAGSQSNRTRYEGP